MLCKFAGFLDFFLAAEYPILLVILSIILYTRKYPKLEEGNFGLPMDEFNPDPAIMPPQYGPEMSGYRAPSRAYSTTRSGLPDFSWCNIPKYTKTGKTIPTYN
jgi:hypothetical protein